MPAKFRTHDENICSLGSVRGSEDRVKILKFFLNYLIKWYFVRSSEGSHADFTMSMCPSSSYCLPMEMSQWVQFSSFARSSQASRAPPLDFLAWTERSRLSADACKFNTILHTEKFFPNLIKSNRNQIVFTILRFIWNQTDVRLVPDKSENGKYNLILV